MKINDTIIRIWLTFLGRPNYVVTDILLNEYGSLQNIWDSAKNKNITFYIQSNKVLASRFSDEGLQKKAITVYEQCQENNISIVTVDDTCYPYNLLQVINKPSVLYYKGKLPAQKPISDSMLLSVVGSRRCTAYGRNYAFQLSKQLAESGIGIVSGMARGIDREAHSGALSAEGYTVAVLGGGADTIYPAENSALYHKICETGCILSEQLPGTPPYKNNFPARNRIISGLSMGTLVVEAAKSSGAMITVDKAFEQSRNVYAVPGNINSPCSEGCNELLKSQGKCVTSCVDIMEDYGMIISAESGRNCGWINGLTDAEAAAASAISNGCYNIDDIVRNADRSVSSISSALTMLEIKGIVSKALDGSYKLIE